MTNEDIEFVKTYREKNRERTGKQRPPCLNCSNITLVECSKLPEGETRDCKPFNKYVGGGGK